MSETYSPWRLRWERHCIRSRSEVAKQLREMQAAGVVNPFTSHGRILLLWSVIVMEHKFCVHYLPCFPMPDGESWIESWRGTRLCGCVYWRHSFLPYSGRALATLVSGYPVHPGFWLETQTKQMPFHPTRGEVSRTSDHSSWIEDQSNNHLSSCQFSSPS